MIKTYILDENTTVVFKHDSCKCSYDCNDATLELYKDGKYYGLTILSGEIKHVTLNLLDGDYNVVEEL